MDRNAERLHLRAGPSMDQPAHEACLSQSARNLNLEVATSLLKAASAASMSERDFGGRSKLPALDSAGARFCTVTNTRAREPGSEFSCRFFGPRTHGRTLHERSRSAGRFPAPEPTAVCDRPRHDPSPWIQTSRKLTKLTKRIWAPIGARPALNAMRIAHAQAVRRLPRVVDPTLDQNP